MVNLLTLERHEAIVISVQSKPEEREFCPTYHIVRGPSVIFKGHLNSGPFLRVHNGEEMPRGVRAIARRAKRVDRSTEQLKHGRLEAPLGGVGQISPSNYPV